MSAFVVDKECINKIVTFLSACNWGNEILHSEVKRRMDEHGYKIENDDELEYLANEMLNMNKGAVDYRYNEVNQVELIRFEYKSASKIQVLKSLQCFLYQCSEGDVPKLELYRVLSEVEDALMHSIIDELPVYRRAKWG